MSTDLEFNEIEERGNLAVVVEVEALIPIQGKDFVELVKLKDLGYTVVAEKIHKIGDKVLFVKYDTVVPETELFLFLVETKFRVKPKSFTEKNEDGLVVGKIYSQGVIISMSKVGIDATVGTDLTKILGVIKYIPKEEVSKLGHMNAQGAFPSHLVSKTDEINLASYKKALTQFQGLDVYITLKIEGSSLTCGYDDSEFFVASRNVKLKEGDNRFWDVATKYNLKEKMKEFPNVILQCELYGEKIQKNKLGINRQDLFVFNVVDRNTRKRYSLPDSLRIVEKLCVPFVPIIAEYDSFSLTFDELQLLADKQFYSSGKEAEGIVVRPKVPIYSEYLKGDLSVKVINRNYKL